MDSPQPRVANTHVEIEQPHVLPQLAGPRRPPRHRQHQRQHQRPQIPLAPEVAAAKVVTNVRDRTEVGRVAGGAVLGTTGGIETAATTKSMVAKPNCHGGHAR